MKPPPKPDQKYPIGTRISKKFVDPLTNEPRAYEAEVTKYEFVDEKNKWLYYCYYETDDEGEYMSEYAIAKHRTVKFMSPEDLFCSYFGSMFNLGNGVCSVNWKQFMEDLNQAPAMAHVRDYHTETHATSGAYPLQYALLVPGVPDNVIQRLIALNPDALGFVEEDHGWNTLQWMLILPEDLENISPNILRTLLTQGDDEWAIEEEECNNNIPIEWFIQNSGPVSEQVKAILDCSPYAVAWVLKHHYTGEREAPTKLVTLALNSAYEWETGSPGGFFDRHLLKAETDDEEGGKETLLEVLFAHLQSDKVRLFHRFLKTKAKSIIESRLDSMCTTRTDVDTRIDTTSVT